MLTEDGSLDRAKLATVVFGDEAKRKQLNAIIHPLIADAGAARAQQLATTGEPLAGYEAALLVENGLADAFRPLVVVACSEAAQRDRAATRDHASPAAVEARLRAQLPLAAKLRAADLVIDNDGTRDELIARTDDALAELCARAGVPTSRYPVP